MPPKGSKSPRTKSPKNVKADPAIAWEALLTTSSVNQVRNVKTIIYSFCLIGYIG